MSKIVLEGGEFDGECLEVTNPQPTMWMMRETEISHYSFGRPLMREAKLKYVFNRAEDGVLFYQYSDLDIYAH